jgi:hypothetical protein
MQSGNRSSGWHCAPPLVLLGYGCSVGLRRARSAAIRIDIPQEPRKDGPAMAGVEEEPSQARRFPRTLEGSRREPASAERCGFVTEGETYNAARPADGRLPVPENLDGSALPHETGLQRLAAVTSRRRNRHPRAGVPCGRLRPDRPPHGQCVRGPGAGIGQSASNSRVRKAPDATLWPKDAFST